MTSRSTASHAQERGAMTAFIAAMLMLGTLGIFVNEARLDSVTIVFFRCAFGAAALFAYCLWQRMFRRANFQLKNVGLALASGVLLVRQLGGVF